MLRFDPTEASHTKYEITNTETTSQMKKKRDKSKRDEIEISQPTVSKDVFYKVTDNLKDSLQQGEGFSLLNLFGKSRQEESNDNDNEPYEATGNCGQFDTTVNPFRYDSSDDEPEELQNKDSTDNSDKKTYDSTNQANVAKIWSEPFFFKDDDFRFQEGFDFIKRMELKDRAAFVQQRRSLKEIIKAKVRNSQRKNKPFKRKLGGAKRKKMIRVKKAMKR